MKIVIFAHPNFLNSQSMPRFASMIYDGMKERGHNVEIWRPSRFFSRIPFGRMKKWFGYLDQYLLFPIICKWKILKSTEKTLFVFSDQALGPWVPLVNSKPHVIHVHDFIALRSSLNKYPFIKVSWTGKIYQNYIKNGFSRGRVFISVSLNTKKYLDEFLMLPAIESTVIFNGLNYPYRRLPETEAWTVLESSGYPFPSHGFLLHVGGNQWYKNRIGVLAVYRAYAAKVNNPFPLVMIGANPTPALLEAASLVLAPAKVIFVVGASTQVLEAAYSKARLLIFPSITEGFGWPIVEAMACGCPVVTSDAAPMNEVGSDYSYYVPCFDGVEDINAWADKAADRITRILTEPDNITASVRSEALKYVEKFDAGRTMSQYEMVYKRAFGSDIL